MPIRLGQSRYEPPRHDFLGGYKGLSWVGRNRYDPIDFSNNLQPTRVGTIRGGPTLSHAYDLAFEPGKYTAISPTPRLGSPLDTGTSRPRTGSFSLDQINWVNNLSQLTGPTIGQQNPYVGAMGWSENGPEPTIVDPMLDFFAQRDMDMMNAPRRLLDYAFSPLAAVGSMAGAQTVMPTPDAKPLPFQTSPYYWSWLQGSTPEQRKQQARLIADSRADRARNQPLYDMLVKQFDQDYNGIDAKSSGNERIDYIAKAYLQNPTFDAELAFNREAALAELEAKDPRTYTEQDWRRLTLAGRGELVTDVGAGQTFADLIPWVGTQMGHGIDPIQPGTEAQWLALRPEDRHKLLTQAGMATMLTDISATFVGLPAVGKTVQFLGDAKRVESLVASTRFADYAQKLGVASQFTTNAATRSLDAVNKLMGVGLINMTASWAMQSYAPVDSPWAEAGRAMDASRTVSDSMLAGVLNEAGFWAGFYGVGPAFNALKRGGGAAAKIGPAGRRAFGGMADLAFHTSYGGSSLASVLERDYGLSRQFQGTAESALFESSLLNSQKETMSRARMALDAGEPTGTYLDEIVDPEERIRAWEAAMALPTEHATRATAIQIEMLNSRILGGEAEKIARAMDERVNRYALDRFGQLWVAKVAGRLEVPEIQAAVTKRLSALTDGAGDTAAIAKWAGKDTGKWGQALRKTHQLLFHRRHHELLESAEQAGEDTTRYALFTERNLFADDVDDQVARLTDAGGDGYMRELIEAKDDVERLFADHAFATPDELADLLLQMRPGMPGRRFIEPGDGRLDQFQDMIETEGLWTIGTKPEGVFIRQQFGGWVNPAAVAPETLGRARQPVSAEQLVAMGYRKPFPGERMSGREFVERDPIWPTADQGGGVWIKARQGDAPPAPRTPSTNAARVREQEFADASAYWGDKPWADDLEPVYEFGTEQVVYDTSYSGTWMAAGQSEEAWLSQADDHLWGEFKPDRQINSSVRPIDDMIYDWEQAYIHNEPPASDAVTKAGVIVTEELADGSIGIWTLHPKDLADGTPFEGWDGLTFPRGSVESRPNEVDIDFGPPDFQTNYQAQGAAWAKLGELGMGEGSVNVINRFLRRNNGLIPEGDPSWPGGQSQFADQVEVIDSLAAATTTTKRSTLWRVAQWHGDGELRVGASYDEPGFNYVAKERSSLTGLNSNILHRFDYPEGMPLISDNYAAIMPRGLRWVVTKVDRSGDQTVVSLSLKGHEPLRGGTESLRATAARELREEMGFDGRLDGWVADIDSGKGYVTRYYSATRWGGGPQFSTTPDEVGRWVLADPRKLPDQLTRYGRPNPYDLEALDEALKARGYTKLEGGIPETVSGNNFGADWPVLKDRYSGRTWVFKAMRGATLTSLPRSLQVTAPTAAKLFQYLDLHVAPEVPFSWQGIRGTIQPFLDVDQAVLGTDLANFAKTDIEELQRIHVADWFTSQHDTNTGSVFLLNDGRIASVDKGQAWKFFGRDEERIHFQDGEGFWTYEPNPNKTLGNFLFDNPALLDRNAVEDVVTRIESMSDDTLRGWLDDLAHSREADGLGSAEDFLDMMIARRDGIRHSVNAAYKRLGQLEIAPRDGLQTWAPGGTGRIDFGGPIRVNSDPLVPMQSPDLTQPALPDAVVDGSMYLKVGLVIEDEGDRIWATTRYGDVSLPVKTTFVAPNAPDDFGLVADMAAAAGMEKLGVSVRVEEFIDDVLDDAGDSITRWFRATRTGGGPKWAAEPSHTILFGTRDVMPGFSPDGGATILERLDEQRLAAAGGGGPERPIQSSMPMPGPEPTPGPGNEYVSYTVLPNGQTYRSPWIDYPLRPSDDVLLGNRAFMSQKLDAVFRGWRTSRILEMQKASLYRRLDSKSAAFSPTSVVRFHDGLLELARKHGFAGVQPLGLSAKWVELPGLKSIYEEVTALAEDTFGKGPYLGRDGRPVTIDWGREVAKAYRTSMKLNLTAGLTSTLKSMGYTGAQAGFISDLVYPALRFALSPLFKAGEWAEAYILNGMRGQNPFGMDDTARAIWQRGGLPTSGAEYAETALSDPMLAAAGRSVQRHDALRQQFMRTPPPDAYAAEVARTRYGPVSAPETAATQGAQPQGPLGEAIFPRSPGERRQFSDVPEHDVDSLIPTKIDPDTGEASWDVERILELNEKRLAAKIEDWSGLLAKYASRGVNELRSVGWAMGWLATKFSRDEIRRFAENVPIIHATGSGYSTGMVDEMAGLDDIRVWLEDGIKPLSGPAGRGQISNVKTVTTRAGEQGVITEIDRPSTSMAEQLAGHLDAAYAGTGRWNDSLAFVLRNDRVIPRMVSTDTDRIGVMRHGTENAIDDHVIFPNGVADIYEAAIRYGAIMSASESIAGNTQRSLLSLLAYGGPFSSMAPIEHALPGGGDWTDIAAVMLGNDFARQKWADIVAQYGDSVPGLRDIEVIGKESEDAWRFAMERAGISDRADLVPTAGDIDEGRIPDLMPDDLITPQSVEEMEQIVFNALRREFAQEPRIKFSLEDRIRSKIAELGKHIRVARQGPSKNIVDESGYSITDADRLRAEFEENARFVRENVESHTVRIRDLELLLEEITDWRGRAVMSGEEAVWIANLGHEDQAILHAAAEQDAQLMAFMDRARAMGATVDSTADDWTFDGASSFDIRAHGDPRGPAVGGVSGELPPGGTDSSYGLKTTPDQAVVVVRAVNAYLQQARSLRPRDVGTFGSTWTNANAAMDAATRIAPPEFVDELVRRASLATGQAEPAPIVKVWQTGTTDSIGQNTGGRIIVTVSGADGTYPLSLAEIQEAWMAHGLPESVNAMGTPDVAPDLQSIWLDNPSAVIWTPEGAATGTILMSRPQAYMMPTGTWRIGVSGKWEFVPSPDLAATNSYVGHYDLEFRYAYGGDDAIAAWNLNDDVRIAHRATVEVDSINAVPEHGSTSAYEQWGLPVGGKFRFSMDAEGKLEWVYALTDRGSWDDLRISNKVRTVSGAEEALRDARAELGDRDIRVMLDPTSQQMIAAGRLKLLGDIPDNWVFVNVDTAEVIGDDMLRSALPRRPVPELPPDSLEEVAGSAEELVEAVGEGLRERLRAAPANARAELADAWEAFWNPVPEKQRQQDRLIRKMTREWFPDVLERHMPPVFDLYHNQIGVPRAELVDFIIEDRRLLMRWVETKDEADFAAMVMHADKYGIAKGADPRADLDSLHESPDWTVLQEVMHWTAKGAVDEAFGVHFFNQYRSTFERSINHPLLGVYPASWAYKVAKEWARFLFHNETFGFNIGMQPARFIYEVQHAQQVAFARDEGMELDEWYDNGPLSSTIFIFNLLMPGDWSNIPFPLSRTLRDLLRGQTNPLEHLQANLIQMGVGRDVRLATEVAEEWWNLGPGGGVPERREGEQELVPVR